jgi:hypothetical protein
VYNFDSTTLGVQNRPAASRRWGRPNARRSGIGTIVLALVAGLLPLLAIAPAAHAAAGELSFVDAASTAGNRTNHTVRIPTTVNAGDALVLYLTTNSTSSTIDETVSGWSLLQSRDGDGIRGRAWTKTADAADAGANVTVTTSALAKSVIGVAAYRSTGDPTVAVSAVGGGNNSSSSHTAPAVTIEDENAWLVTVWTGKSSTDTCHQTCRRRRPHARPPQEPAAARSAESSVTQVTRLRLVRRRPAPQPQMWRSPAR